MGYERGGAIYGIHYDFIGRFPLFSLFSRLHNFSTNIGPMEMRNRGAENSFYKLLILLFEKVLHWSRIQLLEEVTEGWLIPRR